VQRFAQTRELKRSGRSYYTISSAGHEQNVVLGALLGTRDPCFLHYRSGALMMARGRRAELDDPVLDTLLGLVASSDEPIAQGRHKVWGSRAAWVPPQTSTIGSHLPKAVGLAFALSRAKRMRRPLPVAPDAIVCCSFGDASASHATALAALNAARYAFRGGNPTPILFVCEDNRIGISTRTPSGWIRERFGTMATLAYYEAAGSLDQVWRSCVQAVRHCRNTRGPVFLRLDCFAEIKEHEVVGFDTETRPSFVRGQIHIVSLLQLAIPHKVFLIRLNHTGLAGEIMRFFENDAVIKAGVGIRDDIKILNKLGKFEPAGFTELSTMAREAGLEVESVKKLAALLLGFRISKGAQTSNWEAETLSEKQLMYAATDAWVCLEIYRKLIKHKA
jgi:hypothetical protein